MNTEAEHKRWLVIVNPVANRGAAKKKLKILTRQLQYAGIRYDLIHTEHPRHAKELAFAYAQNYSVILAVGGDGTVHEVINGLIQYATKGGDRLISPTVGIIPAGSGNDYIKILNMPSTTVKVTEAIFQGQIRWMEIGEIIVDEKEKHYFHNNVGAGFDAYVNEQKSRIPFFKGHLVYLLAVIQSLFRFRHPHLTIEWNDQTLRQRSLLTHIGIGRCSGGGFYLTPDAIPDDGLFDICVIASLGKMKMLKELPKALKGTHTTLKEVRMFRTKQLRIHSDLGIPVHADGETIALKARRLDFRILPHRIPFFYGSGK